MLCRCDLRTGDGDRDGLRVSSKDGMFCTGETGTVGLRIDLRGTDAVDWTEHCQFNPQHRNRGVETTLRRLPLVFCRASRPPGPRLLLRDFLSFVVGFARGSVGSIASISAVAFSLSTPAVIFGRGTWAIERRERGPRGPAESLLGAMGTKEGVPERRQREDVILKRGTSMESRSSRTDMEPPASPCT
jgi:hypothetical protein